MYLNVFPREKYISRIRPFFGSDIVKVITGIRRCGKSFILRGIINELLSSGVDEKNIIYIPLDKKGYRSIKTPDQLENEIEKHIMDNDFKYLFIDEVQNVNGFESIVLEYQEEGYSIFLTGSNSYLLSEEISTKLTGRYLSFDIYPLDFKEFLDMKKFYNLEIAHEYDEFDEYVEIGGFPKNLEFSDMNSRKVYTRGIIDEIFKKDVKTRKKIMNIAAYERVQSFIINNYSSTLSLNNLFEAIEKEGISVKANTLRNYIEDMKKAKIVYECNRFDLKSKKSIAREQKYYLADMSIYFSMNVDNRLNYGPSLENMVYLYLVSSGFEVSIGKIGDLECDFIVRDINGRYAYIQVAYTLHGEDENATNKIKERELRPFRKIRDGYSRYIISLDRLKDQQEGVRHINAIDLFLGKEKIST